MLEFFRVAEATRNPNLSDVPLKELMETAAKEAGWHIEIVDNLRSKKKDAVRYDKPFSSEVTAELVHRMRGPIMRLLSKREIDRSTVNSYLGYGFFNFIKTYKPDVHNTDDKIKSALYWSIKCKLDQGNRKEIFKYRPGYTGERSGKRYLDTPREISFSTPIRGKDGDNKETIEDFICNKFTSPVEDYLENLEDQDEREELINTYSDNNIQEAVLDILIEAGGSGKLKLSDLKLEIINNESIRDAVVPEINIKIRNRQERAKKKNKEFVAPVVNEEFIQKYIARKVKLYYRELKSRLAEKYGYLVEQD